MIVREGAHRSWRRLELPSGVLEVQTLPGALGLEELCSFGARPNPRRGFLFISKVLGRYRPVRPSALMSVQRRLEALLPAGIDGPVVFVGVAEAGVALGQGVHAQYQERTARSDVLFVHSTRHRFDAPVALAFDERHSHAPEHRIYMPTVDRDAELLRQARTVVVVDDEVTTGRTFADLVANWVSSFPSVCSIWHLVLTSWLAQPLPDIVREVSGDESPEVKLGALLQGRYRWSAYPDARLNLPPGVVGDPSRTTHIPVNWGRFGLRRPRPLPSLGVPSLSKGERILVLGTGEFQYAPFQLAYSLEGEGYDVRYQCTTRAPVSVGGAITSRMAFPDNYRESVTHYLYNTTPDTYDRVLICAETPNGSLAQELTEPLHASTIYL